MVNNLPIAEAAGAASSADAEEPDSPRCLHCDEPIELDDIWGWTHAGHRYLCVDPGNGEPLCSPATLI
ncbi:MAG TPA: hypothetical protein VGB74_19920 [Actinoplanes sp.]